MLKSLAFISLKVMQKGAPGVATRKYAMAPDIRSKFRIWRNLDMSIPLLEYSPSSQNQRVEGYEVPGDEQPRIFTTSYANSRSDMDALIAAAYRQMFNEQQMTASSRQVVLESQLRSGQITVRGFIQGLATSDLFRSRNYDTNSNYRFVQMCVQRILGRDVYGDREKLAWSTVLATKGLNGFIDELVNSNEYVENFGDNTVPYQRRRILPQRTTGELPFNRMARYDAHYRDSQPRGGYSGFPSFDTPFNLQTFLKTTDWTRVSAVTISLGGVIFFLLLLAATVGQTGA
jgi:phycobilisome rod-core linker protein